MIDRTQLKREWKEMKTELSEVKAKLNQAETALGEAEARLVLCETFSNPANKLKKFEDIMEVTMPSFSEYRRSGKAWYGPPFYYGKGYKMCLAMYASGVGEGAGTHVSVAMFHSRGEYDDHLKWPPKCDRMHNTRHNRDGIYHFFLHGLEYPAVNKHVQVGCQFKFCSLNNEKILRMVNDSLTVCIEHDNCFIRVEIRTV
jgi:hypothetical protein